ncbi:maleylpyruvate isomerase family mycothiol-dependent enzyme [Rhodococcoides fascians]|uniref:maleylpyruvate isomerase family mycothiol-dependent enzyme n=1 Tax=Rhodococcoides fascians TaxID=1828 RepID=UPI000569DAD1|nr:MULTISPECIES: maleylpyruvate isomerase family mycothiol-dependent enzyme [Rhodococcus]OZE95464.1 maleylpyruvate isomerase family mycothiol-dependent enzyme [Rhodococcus sp. 15-1189-1-1a]OZF10094.1 maleylpyruvate isomerase family mycothiol-dependent enzyme [Rhodococcus sp. 14-2686-1-2]
MSFNESSIEDRLLVVRRGTSYFAQRLSELTDAELDEPTLLSGWTRRHLVAHVGYNAAALCRLMDWAASGIETPMYESTEQRGREIDEGATLSPAAIRNLFDHTVARLDEKWRNLPVSAWDAEVRTAQGRTVPSSETIWMRTREVWIHAVDLGNGGRFADFPEIVDEGLLSDIVGMWRKKGEGGGLALSVDGDERVEVAPGSAVTTTVRGSLPAVTRWAAGRGAIAVSIVGEDVEPPRWL